MEKDRKKAVIGLSGGVDSAVAAYLLKKEGYEVFAAYLKNWTETDEKGVCPAEADREDAIRVAAKLDISFATVDYEKEYRERVFAPFLNGLSAGENPNPDILCNPLVKFAALSAVADDIGAYWIATGHYARKAVLDSAALRSHGIYSSDETGKGKSALLAGRDAEKDQSYFLSRIAPEQLERSLFPLGEMNKKETRELAQNIGLHVAQKPGTSGICFIGERNFAGFMKGRVPAAPGPIIDAEGRLIGEHRGLPFYTIGQRHGFGDCISSASEPYYVAEKRLASNTLVVARAYEKPLYRSEVILRDPHWILGEPRLPFVCETRLRYRQPLQKCTLIAHNGGRLEAIFSEPQKAVAPGQYAAFYRGEICLGSAIIE